MPSHKILLAPGDGIGPEIVNEAAKILGAVTDRFGHRFECIEAAVGGAAIARHQVALTGETLERARAADAVLFGAIGDPRYDDPQASVRPEQAILGLRKGLGLFANLRPVRVREGLGTKSPLRDEVVRGTDMLVVRELTGGIYFGTPRGRHVTESGLEAVDTMRYTEAEIERVMHTAFRLARGRRRRVTSVDKANVLATSRLWREVAMRVSREHDDVDLEHMLVDACAMDLLRRPTRFDVIVTSNLFGDILTDEASMLCGSLGMMPSASLGERRDDGAWPGLYEPIHGSAPDIAGSGKANPIGMILSTAMMLRTSLGLHDAAASVEQAVEQALEDGGRTVDIASKGSRVLTTSEMGDEIAARVRG
jgi:3-isopropylmalate dehydrogenase